jgi:hypothetical protein
MDYFHRAQVCEIGVGGYKCYCCTPVGKYKRRQAKTALHRRTRSRLKQTKEDYDALT